MPDLLQTLQRSATLTHRLDEQTEQIREFRTAATSRLERLETQLVDVRERLARLEATRNADHAQMQAELTRFQLEVERAAIHLRQLLPGSNAEA